MKRVTRRELGKIAGGLAALRAVPLGAQTPSATPYIGPLTGVTGVGDRAFDPVAYSVGLFDEAPRRLRFQATTRAEAEAWQKTLRVKLTELLGGFPSRRAPLDPTVLETREFTRYRREKVVFNSRPGVSVLAYVLTPRDAKPPARTMICLPGHGRGVDDIVGIDDKGHDRSDKSGYQHDFAIQVVEAGMAAVAIEPMAFGCRRDPVNARRGLTANACQPSAGGALLVGQTMIG